uniref:Uncharacterized protein n=1 Tax=viral metagenome TaxID=1070528 RepID=A0A6C0ET62_9ZZZZ
MTTDSLKTLSLRRSYMKKKSSSSKKNQKKYRISSNKTKKASKKNSLMTYYSNLSKVYKNTILSKLLQRFLKHSSAMNSKYPYMEITACIFAQFNPVNLKLVNAISMKPYIFFKNTENAVGKYYKDIHPVDLYYTSIVCGCAYKNDVLIGLMVTMLNDKNIDGNLIRNILKTLLSGYIPKNDIMEGGIDWRKVIFPLIFIANLIYFLIQCNHFYYSTRNLMIEMKEGKTLGLLNTLKEISDNSEVLRKCVQYNDVHPVTKTQELFSKVFAEMGNDVYKKFTNINSVYNCLENPITANEIIQESEWMSASMNAEKIIEVDEIIEKKPIVPIMKEFGTMTMDEVSSKSLINIDTKNPLVVFGEDISYINELSTVQKEKINKGLIDILEVAKTKKTYKEVLEYLDDLAEPENDKLAQQLLDNDDFIQYAAQENERREKFKDMYKINIRDTSLIGMMVTITGAVTEVFFKYSHAPFLDIINAFRSKFNQYIRMIRGKYNAYTDLIEDVTVELENLNVKVKITSEKLVNILVSGFMLSGQIVGISYYGLIRFKNRNLRRIANGNANLIEN